LSSLSRLDNRSVAQLSKHSRGTKERTIKAEGHEEQGDISGEWSSPIICGADLTAGAQNHTEQGLLYTHPYDHIPILRRCPPPHGEFDVVRRAPPQLAGHPINGSLVPIGQATPHDTARCAHPSETNDIIAKRQRCLSRDEKGVNAIGKWVGWLHVR
jgi:hypothetical protein